MDRFMRVCRLVTCVNQFLGGQNTILVLDPNLRGDRLSGDVQIYKVILSFRNTHDIRCLLNLYYICV